MFHWICPECGREIPPSVRECQACDPNAVGPSAVETIETAQVAQAPQAAASLPEPEPLPLVERATEPVLEPAPVALAASEPVVVEPAPALEIKTAFAPTESAPDSYSAIEPVAEEALVAPVAAEASLPTFEPAQILEPELVAQPEPAVEPVFEPAPALEIKPSAPQSEAAPLIEHLPAAAAPVAEALPVEELPVAASVATSEPAPVPEPEPVTQPAPAIERVFEPAPVAVSAIEPVVEKAPLTAEPGPVAEALPVVEPVAQPEPAIEPVFEPLATTVPLIEPLPVAAAPKVDQPPAPVAEAVTETAPEPAKASIELHEVPDPLLALAEQIRAVQAARAAALAAPAESAGLLELAGAVGISESTPVPVAEVPVLAAAPVETLAIAEVTARFKVVTPTALLEPPRYEMALLTPPEPVSLVRSQPVALAPEPQEEADLEAPASVPQPEGPTLPLAPMQKYTPATSRSIQPVPPRAHILSADSGPRITLPGPTLPPALTRLKDANVVTLVGEPTAQRAKEAITPKKSAGGPSWLVSIGVMMLLLAAGLGVVFYLLPHTVADAKPGPTPAQAASTTAPAGPSSPLAKFIEVTGFRVVVDENKKSEVQYLVVNHSAADISNANIFITLRSVKPGQPPLCRFSFKVPSLAPFESKEMSSPIEKTTRGITLPDWQDLRADVQIN